MAFLHHNMLTEIKREWVSEGRNGTLPAVPGRKGYTFAGWNPENACQNISTLCNITAKYASGDMKIHVVYF